MATFEFKVVENGTVYDFDQVTGRKPGAYSEEDAAKARARYEELPLPEKKALLVDDWAPRMREALGGESPGLDNYLINEAGFLDEAYGDTDSFGQDISAAAGQTMEGVADRIDFLTSPEMIARSMGGLPSLGALGSLSAFIPASQNPLAPSPQSPGIQTVSGYTSDILNAQGAREMGQNLQIGTKQETKTFEPLNPKWWVEKAAPSIGGMIVDLGLAAATGPAAPATFALSASSQVGGQTLNEARSAYRDQARQVYEANLSSGMPIAQARTLLRDEIQKGEEKANTEAAIVGTVSGIINSVPGARLTAPVQNKIKSAIAKKGVIPYLRKVGVSGMSEGVAEVLDEITQDAGRLGRDIGDLPERWEKWKRSEPGQRYLAAGTIGFAMGGGVDAVSNTTEILAKEKQEQLQERVQAKRRDQAPVELSSSLEVSTPTEEATEVTEELVEPSAPIEEEVSEEESVSTGASEEAVTEEVPLPRVDDSRIRNRATPVEKLTQLKKGQTVSWLTPNGDVEVHQVQSRKGNRITLEDGRTTDIRPGQMFRGTVTPRANNENLALGDVVLSAGALYRYIGNGDFQVGSNVNGEILFDRTDIYPLPINLLNDPRSILYSREAFRNAWDQYRDDPSQRLSQLLAQQGEKPLTNPLTGAANEQARTLAPEEPGAPSQGERAGQGITQGESILQGEPSQPSEARQEPSQEEGRQEVGRPDEPPLAPGMVRLYHGSAAKGRYTGPAWFSTDRRYARDYRGPDSELQYVDYPAAIINSKIDPNGYGQTLDRGFSWSGELDSSETGPRQALVGSRRDLDSGPASKSQVAARAESNTQSETTSLDQFRAELTRRARLDRKRKGADVIEANQIENLVQLIDASAEAIATRTGRAKQDILSRIAFGHDGRRSSAKRAGSYGRLDRVLAINPGATASTVVHEWGHHVLEEYIYNPDETLNILNPEERRQLESYIRDRKPGMRLLMQDGQPTAEMHEYFAGLLERMFENRYYEGRKPSGMPDGIFNILKKVGDFIRQVYSKVRYQNVSANLDGSMREEKVLVLLDRIFIPDQIEQFVNQAEPPTDVLLPSNDPGAEPNPEVMAQGLIAFQKSRTKQTVPDESYRKLDRLEAEGRLGQPVAQPIASDGQPAPRRGGRFRQPMLAARELDRALEDGITTYVNLMEGSRYEVRDRNSTLRAAREYLGSMSTGEAIASLMGDPYSRTTPVQGQLPPEVYVASAMILANRLRGDLELLPSFVAQGNISANESLEIAGIYERYLRYFVETISPGAGRAVDILNEYRKPVSTRDRVGRLMGVIGATNTRVIQSAVEKLGPQRLAWIRAYAERARIGDVSKQNYERRVREFKAEFQATFPPDQQAYARSVINDASKLFQTILENPDTAVPGAAVQAFGQNYWFSEDLWSQVEGLTSLLDAMPPNSISRDMVHGEIVALLSTEAGIPLGSMISSHFMAQYLCAPSTTYLSLAGNMAMMTGRIGALLAGYSRNPAGNGVNPNLVYLPQMISEMARVYGPIRKGRTQSGVAWKNMASALRGFGPGTRMHQGRLSANEIFVSANRYTTPEGRIQNAIDTTRRVYSLLIAAPFRLLSVADAAIGTGTSALTSVVAASQAAHWNAERYAADLAAHPEILPTEFRSAQEAVRAFRNAEYTRMMGYSPEGLRLALRRTSAQSRAIAATPELARSRILTATGQRSLQWGIFQQELERVRLEEISAEQNAVAPDRERLRENVRMEAGAELTPEREEALIEDAYAAELNEQREVMATSYQQEKELDRALASFSYIPGGYLGQLVESMEGFISRAVWNVGRIGGTQRITEEGNIAVEGGLNVGELRPLRVLLPFLRASALGVVATIQFSPLGWIAVARRGPIGGANTWTQAEYNTFAMMSLMGTAGFVWTLLANLGDDDPLEEGKKHVIGPIPNNDWGRRLRSRGIEDFTEYTLNEDGSVTKNKLNTIQGPIVSPLLFVGAYNSVRWDPSSDERSRTDQLFETSKLILKTLGAMGPLATMARYSGEFGTTKSSNTPGYSDAANALKNLGMDSALFYRRFFNEMGALINNAGRAAGMNWEPDMKNVPATVQGETAQNIFKTLTNDYLVDGGQSRPMLNGNGEPLAEDPNLARKINTITPSTPINDLITEYGLTLAPMSRYKAEIRKGSSEDLRDLFAQVGKERSETLPRHLVGSLTDQELYEYMKDFYRPLLQKSLEGIFKGDPYQKDEVASAIEALNLDPRNNTVEEERLRRQALQDYVNSVRSRVEEISMAQYFSEKNPALDSEMVGGYIEDLVIAAEYGESP